MTSSTDSPLMPRPIVAGSMETPPTTDFDSQTESEVDTDTDADGASSVSDSLVLVKEQEEEEVMGGEQVDTDEEEAEILRRVRRWAIDSRRLRDEASSDQGSAKSKAKRSVRSTQADPDATLTNTTIAEEQSSSSDDDDDDFASHSDT